MMIANFPHWHPSWRQILDLAMQKMDSCYLQQLQQTPNWLPGQANLFHAFSLPLSSVRYILWGESPYPRSVSANGYAFWDASVNELWSPTGFSKPVNRATSLRNLLKMLLVADGKLMPTNTGSNAIAQLDKAAMIQTLPALFNRLLAHGFLLLNATLVWHAASRVKEDAKQWRPFMQSLLTELYAQNPKITLVLFGNIAHDIEKLTDLPFARLRAEHPYNLSFIQNQQVQRFFKPFHLLQQ